MGNMFQPDRSVSTMTDDSQIDKLWTEYEAAVQGHAEAVFKRTVLPWLKRNKYTFAAGNGTWCVWNKDDEAIFPENIKSEKVIDALLTEIPGFPMDLGSMMPDYQKESE